MAGSSYGTIFKITTWGESHGKALGVIIDGCPAGLPLCEEDIQLFLDRRRPGKNKFSTPRKELDKVEILSGVFQDKTTGTPISLLVPNETQKSKDYGNIASIYRPGHADYTFEQKYGIRDYRGGGRSSGRETIGRVAAGAIASKILKTINIDLCTYTKSIGPISIDYSRFSKDAIYNTPTAMPDYTASKEAEAYLETQMRNLDSTGGVMECIVTNMPIGLGDPVFEKLDANLSKAIMSIGAVKAVEIGDGCLVAQKNGSTNNDCFCIRNDKTVKSTNHSGGILGGISDGSDLILRAYVKPTPSIFQEQNTVNTKGEEVTIQIKGRHDPIIVPRAIVVMESMIAITLLDALLINMSSKMQSIEDFYKRDF